MRLLIADDEDYTREGLASGIRWIDFEIDEIMQARDGKAALNIAKWFKPDIILTDIRMPKMDGFEFVHDLLAINPEFSLIFMSGYMEIEYLKNAINLSAVAYIEKPICMEQVKEAIEKAVEEVRKLKKHQKLTLDNVELQMQKLTNILICKDNSKEMVFRKCQELGFPQQGNYNCIIIWDKEGSNSSEATIKDINHWFKNEGYSCLCNYLEQNYYLVILVYDGKMQQKFEGILKKFTDKKLQYTLGIGFPVSDIMNTYISYSSARTAINYAYFDEKSRIFEIDEHILKPSSLDPSIYNEFINMYKNTPYQLNEWFHSLIIHFVETKHYRKEQVNHLIKSFITTILHEHSDLFEYLDGITSEEELEITFEYAKSIYDIQKLLNHVSELLVRKLDNISKYSKVINDVAAFIIDNYSNPNLSIQEVADYMRLSATHLNVLFKQEMKITLKQYLSNIRFEKAKDLLEKEHYNITEIASMCGYTNANYFAKVFKEYSDLTPLEYRKQRNI